MKPSQLGTVLTRMLGLWICVQAIAPFVSGFLRGLLSIPNQGGYDAAGQGWTDAAGSGVYMIVAIVFIVKARQIAGLLFRHVD
jgi:hypothetical protein